MIDLDFITPDLLENTLRALRQADDPPEALIDLNLLFAGGSASRSERIIHLEDYLRSTVIRVLEDFRRGEGLLRDEKAAPYLRSDILGVVAEDFRQNSAELEAWSALFHRYFASINISVEDLAGSAGVVPQQFRRRTNQGLKYLAGIVRRDELKASQHTPEKLMSILPVPDYSRLFGVQTQVDGLVELLVDPSGPRLLCLQGIAGIGKTVLARELAIKYTSTAYPNDQLWISISRTGQTRHAEIPYPGAIQSTAGGVFDCILDHLGLSSLRGLPLPEKLSATAPLLKRSHHLIVIDNVDALSDLDELIQALISIGGETRFILTSRVNLRNCPAVYLYALPELSYKEVLSVIENEIKRRGNTHPLFSANLLNQAYEITGGNPYAVRLISAHIGRFPMDRIIANILEAKQHGAEALFEPLFWNAWHSLTAGDRNLLRILQSAPVPLDIHALADAIDLSDIEICQNLTHLTDHFLLDLSGEMASPCYALTRLTATFLRSGVVDIWAKGEGEESNRQEVA